MFLKLTQYFDIDVTQETTIINVQFLISYCKIYKYIKQSDVI